ncbi:PAS domain-containing protein [Rhodopirellula sp. JC740]|uniref:histidine kinase n=1 Tax=Rhodopirellula halodulae TaxID=2894198 RepID=A0ABS8NH62_9BACT|nr:PAS domain-containing sensor histidine kinase [Rhodopirellula sp. JC740]MCC9642885.1 PAS domain-containing protein [Rhodopirellula sp. JC740]
MIRADERRHEVILLSSQAVNASEQLDRELGYGGLIHNFKNYVLRPDESKYYDDAQENARVARQKIKELRQIQFGEIQGPELPETSAMITAYTSQLAVVHAMAENGASAREIDEKVRFDDQPTLDELERRIESFTDQCWLEAEKLQSQARMLMLLNVAVAIATAILLATLSIRQHLSDLRNRVVYIRLLGESGGIWNWNRQNDEVEYAPKFRRLLGFEGDDTKSIPNTIQASRDRIHPEDLASFDEQLVQQRESKKPFSAEFRMLHHDGDYRWFRTHAHTLFNGVGTPVRTAGMIFNIEDSKQYEHDLQQSNQELQRFAFAASHDLQEPLRAIIGFSQLLQQRYAGDLDDKGQSYLKHIVDGAGRMKALIDDLLALSRVGRSELEIAPVDLNDCVQTAMQNLSHLIQETNADIQVADLDVVEGHEGLLVELFQNLINNAIKFRKPGQRAKVTIDQIREDGRLVVDVSDEGIGIDQSHHSQIFELFKRLHRREQIPGTGIGLALCKRIVDRHNGSMTLVSSLGRGASFRISLPVASTSVPSSNISSITEFEYAKSAEADRYLAGGRQ